MPGILLTYARSDDVDPFDPATSFVAPLHRDLTARGFEVWFDRMAMPSRGLTFHQEIQDALAVPERLVLVVVAKSRSARLRAAGIAVRAPGRQDRHPDPAATRLLFGVR